MPRCASVQTCVTNAETSRQPAPRRLLGRPRASSRARSRCTARCSRGSRARAAARGSAGARCFAAQIEAHHWLTTYGMSIARRSSCGTSASTSTTGSAEPGEPLALVGQRGGRALEAARTPGAHSCSTTSSTSRARRSAGRPQANASSPVRIQATTRSAPAALASLRGLRRALVGAVEAAGVLADDVQPLVLEAAVEVAARPARSRSRRRAGSPAPASCSSSSRRSSSRLYSAAGRTSPAPRTASASEPRSRAARRRSVTRASSAGSGALRALGDRPPRPALEHRHGAPPAARRCRPPSSRSEGAAGRGTRARAAGRAARAAR